ncbi:HesA/MoeB/ThiF family protein [Gaetbulibacter saemankumensis]|uniref:HesA/MoeB/ThiF family protein n=1 Tax=Gaetbulibacter saemankumensis TaxID=311208 RepID=UPI000417EFE2|nr:HesA/MoeB/ThiF family protein [Gaetbulibacter saemankumensis]
MERYNRHIILPEIGQTGQDKISNSKVLVIGAGGLGCPILQYLAAAGVGFLGIIDFDTVDLTNLQRQVLYGNSSLGKNKALAAKSRLSDLNSDINIIAYPEPLTYQNALDLFKQYDIVVDGSDNFATRYLVNDAAVITNKPLVFGAIYKFEGQISVFNYKHGPTYRCLFPNPPEAHSVPNCSDIGVLGVLPGIVGSMQANEVLKIILGIGDVLSGKLLCYNALNAQITSLKFKKHEKGVAQILNTSNSFRKKQLDLDCDVTSNRISFKDVIFDHNIQLIDVREEDEQPKMLDYPITNIPLSRLESHLSKLEPNKKHILFCQSGVRSQMAVNRLKELQINSCFSLEEGASELNQYLKENLKIIENER